MESSSGDGRAEQLHDFRLFPVPAFVLAPVFAGELVDLRGVFDELLTGGGDDLVSDLPCVVSQNAGYLPKDFPESDVRPAGVYSEGRAVVGVGVPRFGGDGIDGEPGSCRRVEPSRANVVQTEGGFLPVAETAEEDEWVLSRRAEEDVPPASTA